MDVLEDWPVGLGFLRDGGSWFFGVWGLLPGLGECACPRGSVRWEERDHRFGGPRKAPDPEACTSPGKHPVVWRDGAAGLQGFRHGWRDAVSWQEWSAPGGVGGSVQALGGRLAVAVPSWCWVLDVDGDHGWRGLVRLFKAGAVTFGEVLGVAMTPRGWHVWVRADHAGWTSGTAQAALNGTLDSVRGLRGLEVKSGGGYVVWPDGKDRWWVPVGVFAEKVAGLSRVVNGWGSVARPYAGVRLVEGKAPPQLPPPEELQSGMWEDWSPEQRERWRDVTWGTFEVQLAGVAKAPAGGRNNRLNAVAWHAGRLAVAGGASYAQVSEVLVRAGVAAGLEDRECRATVRSGLRGLEGE